MDEEPPPGSPGPDVGSQELRGLVVLCLGALALVALLWWWQRTPSIPSRPDGAVVHDAADGPGGAGVASARSPSGATLVVHVTGAVARPGVVSVVDGARVVDVIELAGGATADADLGGLNLARLVLDGEQVVVPTRRPQGATAGPEPSSARRPDGRLDINLATAAQLEELPGVGPVLAQRIVQHREANGPFRQPGDLRAVPGIGERTFQSLAPLIAV